MSTDDATTVSTTTIISNSERLYENMKNSSDEDEKIPTKRRRSSSMDILAEAASFSLFNQQNLNAIASQTVNNTPFSPTFQKPITEMNGFNYDKPLSPVRYARQRGATFSYSPFSSKDPDYSYTSSGGNMALSWLANVAIDSTPVKSPTVANKEVRINGKKDIVQNFSNTVKYDSYAGDLSTNVVYTPNKPTKIKFASSNIINSDENTSHSNSHDSSIRDDEEYEEDEDDGDISHDISLLTSIATKMIQDHHDDSLILGVISSTTTAATSSSSSSSSAGVGGGGGRHRSNSMPQLPSTLDLSKLSNARPRSNSITKEYLYKHGYSKAGIGVYTPEERRQRIERFLEKRRNRVWTKRVKYDVRKNFADSRIRVKGRFIRKSEEELLNGLAVMNQQEVK